jgi:hypothetical protein
MSCLQHATGNRDRKPTLVDCLIGQPVQFNSCKSRCTTLRLDVVGQLESGWDSPTGEARR